MKHPDGLHMMYSRVNQAWFVMWNSQVLRIFNKKWEAEDYMRELRTHQENPIDTTSALAGVGVFVIGIFVLNKLFW